MCRKLLARLASAAASRPISSVASANTLPIGREDARAPVRRTVSQGEMPADVGRDEPRVALRERGVHAPKRSGLVFDRRRWRSFQPAPTPVRTTMATGALCSEASPGSCGNHRLSGRC